MTLGGQIIWGITLLIFCSAIQLTIIIFGIGILQKITAANGVRSIKIIAHHLIVGYSSVVFGHMLQVLVWAGAFLVLSTFDNFTDAIYFALSTYTTLGYGDVILQEGYRIFGSMASVTGWLNFGLSTAFLIEVMTRLLRERIVQKTR